MTEDMKYAVVLPFGHGAHWGHEHAVQVHSDDGGATWVAHANLVDVEAVDGVVVPFGAGSRQALQNVRRVTSEDGVTWFSHDAES
jgi:putative intracellular protease/amidase